LTSKFVAGLVVPIPTYPSEFTYSPVVPFGESCIGPVVEDPIVRGTIFSVSITALVPLIVRSPEILAFPVVPSRKISALVVAVVDCPPPSVLPRAILRSTTGYGYIRFPEIVKTFSPAAPIDPASPVGPVAPDGPVIPVAPVGPETPVAPVAPDGPEMPVEPDGPAIPVAPVDPVGPVSPEAPVGPATPVAPVDPVDPVGPDLPVAPVVPVEPEGPV